MGLLSSAKNAIKKVADTAESAYDAATEIAKIVVEYAVDGNEVLSYFDEINSRGFKIDNVQDILNETAGNYLYNLIEVAAPYVKPIRWEDEVDKQIKLIEENAITIGNGTVDISNLIGGETIDISKLVADGTIDISKLVADGTIEYSKLVAGETIDISYLIANGTIDIANLIADGTVGLYKDIFGSNGEVSKIMDVLKNVNKKIEQLLDKVNASGDLVAYINELNDGVQKVILSIVAKADKNKRIIIMVLLAIYSPFFPLYIQWKVQEYLWKEYKPTIIWILRIAFGCLTLSYFLALGNIIYTFTKIFLKRRFKNLFLVYTFIFIIFVLFHLILVPYVFDYFYKIYEKIIKLATFDNMYDVIDNVINNQGQELIDLIDKQIGNLDINLDFLKII